MVGTSEKGKQLDPTGCSEVTGQTVVVLKACNVCECDQGTASAGNYAELLKENKYCVVQHCHQVNNVFLTSTDKVIFKPNDVSVFSTLSINGRLFVCHRDQLDSLVC